MQKKKNSKNISIQSKAYSCFNIISKIYKPLWRTAHYETFLPWRAQ